MAALPRTLRLLGLPPLPPADAVLVIGGGLYLRVGAMDQIGLWISIRAVLHGWHAPTRAARIAAAPADADIIELIARSLALRLMTSWVPDGDRRQLPDAPSTRLARHGPDATLGHRAQYDLDPSCPRFGPRPDRPPLPKMPARLDRASLDWARDHLHDQITWLIAGTPMAPTAAAGAAPGPLVTLAMLEGREDETTGGVWASGSGPIRGVASDSPGPEAILILNEARPDRIRPGFAAVVAAGGGHLSHAALVARQLGIPALFGVGPIQVGDGQPLVLTAEGTVERPSSQTQPYRPPLPDHAAR